MSTRPLESVDIAEAIRLKGGEKPQRPQRYPVESQLLFPLNPPEGDYAVPKLSSRCERELRHRSRLACGTLE